MKRGRPKKNKGLSNVQILVEGIIYMFAFVVLITMVLSFIFLIGNLLGL